MNKYTSLLLVLLNVYTLHAQIDSNIQFLGFDAAMEMANNQSVAALTQETRLENNYWQNKSFKSTYLPRLALQSNLPDINKQYAISVTDSGTQQVRERFNAAPNFGLAAEQLIPFTGGYISVGSNLEASYDFLNEDELYRFVPINFRLVQPIFRFNEHPWNRKIEDLRYEEAEKDVALQMEQISINTTRLFFNLMMAQIEKGIAELNLTNNDTILKIARGRYDLGRIAENELLQIELQYINSQQALDQAKLDIQDSQVALKNYIGLQNDKELVLLLPDVLFNIDVDLNTALEKAMMHRPEVVEFERRTLEAEKNVKQAKQNSGFNADLSVSFGLNNAANNFNDLTGYYSNNEGINVSLEVPILEWGRSKAAINQAQANQKLVDYNIQQQLITFEEEIISQVNSFGVIRKQVDIAKRADDIGQKRFEVTKNRYLIGNITITDMNIATAERDEARLRYINAIKNYWLAYYNMRKLTLYDFVFNKDIVK